ncbi:MAG: hypothetical protein V3S45_08545, partial [Kiloniellales bacterium]
MPDSGTHRPADFARRSFVTRKLIEAGAIFGELDGAAVALDFGAPQSEIAGAARMGLADLSPLPRTGFKGKGTVAWLAGQGIRVPDRSNRAEPQADGALAARLAPEELLVLGDVRGAGGGGAGGLPARLEAAWAGETVPPEPARGFPVPRADSHAWFLVSGGQSAAMFAKICGIDLRPDRFAQGWVAQTSVARLSAIVIRADLGAVLAYHLLADSASAEYLWDCVQDAMTEFEGAVIGLS